MRRIAATILTVFLWGYFCSPGSMAQIPASGGTYTIDKTLPATFVGNASSGNFTNFQSAIDELNSTSTTFTGAVTFLVTSGQTFRESHLVLTRSGNSNGPITFIKNGVGKNPMIKAPFGSGTTQDGNGFKNPYDAMWYLNGVSYITIDGINLADTGSFHPVPGNTDKFRIETGIVLTNVSKTQGCQHNRIRNCNITLDSLLGSTGGNYGHTYGIFSYISVDAPTLSGTNSYNEFDGDTIPNSNYPILIMGDGTTHDRGNSIGKNKGNYIPKFGMGVTESWGNGTYAIAIFGNEDSVTIANNYIGGNRLYTATSEYGIVVWGYGSGSPNTGCNTVSIYNNTVLNINRSNAPGQTGAAIAIENTLYGSVNIYNNTVGFVTPYNNAEWAIGIKINGTGAGGAIANIHHNYIHDIIHPFPTACGPCSAPNNAIGIYNTSKSGAMNIYSNRIENIKVTSTGNINGSVYGILNYGKIERCDSNRFVNFSNNSTAGSQGGTFAPGGQIYFLFQGIGGTNPSVYTADTLSNFNHTGTGNAYGLMGNGTFTRCIVHDISSGEPALGAYGFKGSGILNRCTIYNISSSRTANAFGVNSNSGVTLNNNSIYGITSDSGIAAGIYTTAGSVTMNGNWIYDFKSAASAGSAYGAFISGTSSSSIINNMINGTMASGGTIYRGLWLSGVSNSNVWNNSFNINTPLSDNTNAAFYADGTLSGLNIRNNIFSYSAVTGFGVPYNCTDNTGSIFDYNIFYNAASANDEAIINGTTYSNTTLIGGGGFNLNSLVIGPLYVSPTDLHITSLLNFGTPVSTVTTDFDGQTRNNPPCIGADELANACNAVAGTISAARDTICGDTPATLFVTGNSPSAQWQSEISSGVFGDIPGATNTSYASVLQETTSLRVIAGSGSCTDTSEVYTLNVVPAPVAVFTPTISLPQVSFNSSGSTDAESFEWNFGDGSPIEHSPNPVHNYSVADTFHVCLTVYNHSNCSFTYCLDLMLIVSGIPTSVNNDNSNIYPNPNNGCFTMSGINNTGNRARIEISNLMGEKVFTHIIDAKDSPGTEIIQLPESIVTGTYIITITSDIHFSTSRIQVIK